MSAPSIPVILFGSTTLPSDLDIAALAVEDESVRDERPKGLVPVVATPVVKLELNQPRYRPLKIEIGGIRV